MCRHGQRNARTAWERSRDLKLLGSLCIRSSFGVFRWQSSLFPYAWAEQRCFVAQGMNFVAGCLLLFMDEEDAFWCLCCIVEDLLPGYFSQAMVAPQVPLRFQVDRLVFFGLLIKAH